MKLGTKTRYAVMALSQLHVCGARKPMKLKHLAEAQGVSLLYLEQIFMKLRRKGLLESSRGVCGGYTLARPASNIYVSEVLQALDDPISFTRCRGSGLHGKGCLPNGGLCRTHHLWENMEKIMCSYLKSVTVADIANDTVVAGHIPFIPNRPHAL